ncbi:hypothetical protein L0665_01610 [Methanogenium marinum]|uniref:Uncharacterized protein n=1 Tax=Methanogenium marinum TaxID=348610 RepID=A0A9Q4PY68_9EURY|nr:hypothetical protein [Methanogenium marinum]MDE4907317.1 hypothetical protein [Methanogenium marinum]
MHIFVYKYRITTFLGDVSLAVESIAAFNTAAAHFMDDNTLATVIDETRSSVTQRRTPTPAS